MGDSRFAAPYVSIRDSTNRIAMIRQLSDEDVIAALAAASRAGDPLVANFLATEAMNRAIQGRCILESLPQAVIALDRDGKVSSLNSAAESLLGILREQLLGHRLFARDSLEDAPLREAAEAALREGGRRVSARIRLPAHDGRILDVQAMTAPLVVHGSVSGVVLVLTGAEPP